MDNSAESLTKGVRSGGPVIPPENLVYQSRSFTIWLDEHLDVWWETNDAQFNEEFQKIQARQEWGEIIAKQTELEALPIFHLTLEAKRGFRFLIGTAILLLFTGKYDQARQTLTCAETFYRARTAEKARIWILHSGLAGALCATVGLAGGGWIGEAFVEGPANLFEQLALSAVAGTWGAFFSLFLRASVLGIDATAGRHLHYLEAGCRILAGFISGGIALCAVAAGIFAPTLLNVGPTMIVLIGFAAGFSERILPSIVGKVETNFQSQPAGASGSER